MQELGERFIGYTVYGSLQGYGWIILRDITDRKIIEEGLARQKNLPTSKPELLLEVGDRKSVV